MRIRLALPVLFALSWSACGKDAALATQVCAKSLAVVGSNRWVDAGALPTTIDMQIDCAQQDPNAPIAGAIGAMCGNSNIVLHSADQTVQLVDMGGDSQYFARDYRPAAGATQAYWVLQTGSKNAGSPNESLLLSVAMPQVLPPAPGVSPVVADAVSAALKAAEVDVLWQGADANAPVWFHVTSGDVNVTAIAFAPANHVAFNATGLPLTLVTNNPNAIICPDQHLHVIDNSTSPVRTSPAQAPNACTASLTGIAPGGYGQATCVSPAGTYNCSDANTLPTSTQCCAEDFRWNTCLTLTQTLVCTADAIAAPKLNHFFVDCRVSGQLEFTCPVGATTQGGTVDTTCCARDPRWAPCNEVTR